MDSLAFGFRSSASDEIKTLANNIFKVYQQNNEFNSNKLKFLNLFILIIENIILDDNINDINYFLELLDKVKLTLNIYKSSSFNTPTTSTTNGTTSTTNGTISIINNQNIKTFKEIPLVLDGPIILSKIFHIFNNKFKDNKGKSFL